MTDASTELAPINHIALGSRPLRNAAHERYARARSMSLSYIEAARQAGYETMTAGNAAKLDRKPKIAARIAWLVRQPEEILALKRQRLEEALWNRHDADPGALWETVEAVNPKTGEPYTFQRPRALSGLPLEVRQTIESITIAENGWAVPRQYSAMSASVELRKLLGIGVITRDDGGDQYARMSEVDLINELKLMARELGRYDALAEIISGSNNQ